MLTPRGIIGNYVLERELGRGGMGIVYAATHRVLGRPAAIKVLLANTIEHRDRIERFFNEARAAMAIDHPGIVKIYDVGIAADDRAYIAMELLSGVALAHQLARGPLPLRIAVDVARQIAEALAAAHAAGVIHRDLKPENVIVDDAFRIKLVDFGIAKLVHAVNVRTATGAMLGTPLYMSPEQCEGTRDVDARTDLYSLGCTMFAMLTGRPPFDSGGPGGVIGAHLHVPPPPLASRCPAASPALAAIVETLLAKSRDARFQSARAVVAALAAPEVVQLGGGGEVAVTADAPGPASRAGAIAPASYPASAVTRADTPPSTPPAYAWSPPPIATPAYGIGPPHAPATPSAVVPLAAQSAASPPVSGGAPRAAAPAAPFSAADPVPVATAPPSHRRRTLALVLGSSAVTAVVLLASLRACRGHDAGAPADALAADAAQLALGSDAMTPDEAVSQTPPDAANPSPLPDAAGRGPRLAGVPRDAATRGPRSTGRTPRGTPTPIDAAPPAPVDAAPPLDAAPRPSPSGASARLTYAHGDFGAGQGSLDAVTAAARANPALRVVVVGVANSSEPNPENLALARANRIKLELGNRGIDRGRITLDTQVVDGDVREVRVQAR